MRRMSWFVVMNCVLVFALNIPEFRQEDAVAMPLANAVAQETNSGDQLSSVVPRLVRFSGTVTDATGKVVTGIISLSFSIYELKEGGTPLWSEIQKVQTDRQGGYTVLLGANSSDGLPLDLFTSGKALWLGVQPQLPGAAEQPRLLLVAVPYALKAADADTLGGKPASAFLTAESQTFTATGSGTGLAGSNNPGVGTTPAQITQNGTTPVRTANTPKANAAVSAQAISLPATTGPSVGVINLGGVPFLHNYANPKSIGQNTFVGSNAGNFSMGLGGGLSGSNNTGFGYWALYSNTTGSYNTGVGPGALLNNTTGSYNSAFGWEALWANTTGSLNTAVGLPALAANTTGGYNTAVGNNTLANSTTGYANTAVGEGALMLSRTGSDNTAIGENSTQSNTTGSMNTAIGESSLNWNTTGSGNVGLGESALWSNHTGGQNVAVGQNALFSATVSNLTAVGENALYGNTTGTANTAVGWNALTANSTGNNNAAFGTQALAANTGNDNSAFGYQALYKSTGADNTAVGYAALSSNTTGCCDAALGTAALELSTAAGLTAVGYNALVVNSTGANNTALGFQAGYTATGGNANTTGANNTFIGYEAGPGSATQYNYQTDLGAGAVGTCNSCIVLGRTTDKVAIGATAPSSALTVNGAISNGVTTATSNDNRGKITLVAGTGSYTFTQGPGSGGVWTTAPICVVSSTAARPVEAQVTTTTSSLTITVPGGRNTDTYNYICWPGN